MQSKAYSARDVNQVNAATVAALSEAHAGEQVWVGVDVGKYQLKAVVHWGEKQFERPWSVQNPLQIPLLIDHLRQLAQGRKLVLALEPSGTYGDALRQAAADAGLVGLEVHRVATKVAHDYAEVFDGVPSQHDGKDAAVVAELARLGKSSPWPYQVASEWQQSLEYWVDRLETAQQLLQMWSGRLEGRLARHWPEASQVLKVRSATLLQALRAYGGPKELAGDAGALAKLKGWGGRYLGDATARVVLNSAGRTVGVRMTATDLLRMKQYAQAAWEAREQVKQAKRHLARLAKGHATIQAMGQAVGVATACVLWAYLGDPHDYHCGEAYVKAMGLNLKERSSGVYQGKLKISKRGPGAVRYWMWLGAWRLVKQAGVKQWYQQKKQRDGNRGMRALVGIMRRVGLAVWHVGACGEVFEAERLFPGGKKGR